MKKTFKNVKFNKLHSQIRSVFTPQKMLIPLLFFAANFLFASGGGAALNTAASDIRAYVPGIIKLLYAVGIIVGIVGGIRIYNKWTNGDQDINKEIVGWTGACVFLLAVPTFIQAIFPA